MKSLLKVCEWQSPSKILLKEFRVIKFLHIIPLIGIFLLISIPQLFF